MTSLLKEWNTAFHGWYRGFIQGKTRIVFAWLFGVALVLTAQNSPTLPGIVICFVGATLRFWASGYLYKDSKLSVGGPFSWTRNPLYLGTYLMAVGTAVATGNWVFFVVLSVFFAAVYHYIILDEETKLSEKFGQPYDLYCQTVSRFFPSFPASQEKRLQINPNENQHRFSWDVMMRNRAYEAYAAFAALIGFVWLISFFWRELG